MARKQSSEVIGMIRSVLEEQGLQLRDIDLVVVDTGPGSFSGVRTGIGIAQGVAYGNSIQVCGVNSLAILAAGCQEGVVLPVIDARMCQVYSGLYRMHLTGQWQELVSPHVIEPESISVLHEDNIQLVGNGWQTYRTGILKDIRSRLKFRDDIVYPDAESAIKAVVKFGMGKPTDPTLLQATYVRHEVAKKTNKG